MLDPQNIPVVYPERALKRRWGGTMIAMFSVDRGGNVFDIRVVEPTKYDILDEAAVSALKRWRPPKALWGTVENRVPFVFTP